MDTVYLIIGLIIYFLPSIFGFTHKQVRGIFLLNFFLGWTLIGWLGAFVWAVVRK